MTDDAVRLLESLKDTKDGCRYQSVNGKEMLSAAHELENAGFALWKGNSFGTNFYCITDKGLKALVLADRKN